MNAQRVIVVILAYGLWGDNKRSPKENVGYGMYLNECANALRHLVSCGHDVSVILCGGVKAYCEKSEEELTEARSMQFFFNLAQISRLDPLDFILEDKSLTTPANIWEAYKKIEEYIAEFGIPNCRILFLCDAVREVKVRTLVWLWNFLAYWQENRSCKRSWSPVRSILSWPKPEVLAFNRPDITPKSTKIFQLFETFVLMLAPWILNKRTKKLREPTSRELADALFDSEIIEEEGQQKIAEMDFNEALDYSLTLMTEFGIENPREYLKEKGILW